MDDRTNVRASPRSWPRGPQREKSGLSLAQVAERLGAASRNAYARYEQGRAVPTIDKFEELLRAISPDRDLVVHQSDAA